MKYILPVLFCFMLIHGCKKDEELMSGDIEGNVTLVGLDYQDLPMQAGIHVDLFNSSVKINTTPTDEAGKYVFEDLPYGRYVLRCSFPGYVRSFYEVATYHIGGYSPTIANISLYEVPAYQITIDSVSFYEPDDRLRIHLKIDGDTLPPGISYLQQFRAFLSNSPGVSKDNYAVLARGILADWTSEDNIPGTVAVYGIMVIYEILDFESITSLPVYMVIYPITNNQGVFPLTSYLPESLGPASNEVVFDWNEISGE